MDAQVNQIEAVKPKYRSGEELAMRALIVPELRRRYPTARIIHELPLRYSTNRIDLAAVTETEIVSVEIKSSRDVCDRLEAQLRAFTRISSRVIVALAPKWNEKLPAIETKKPGYTAISQQYTPAQETIRRVGGATETWTVDAELGVFDVTDSAYRDALPCTFSLLDMLHVSELKHIAGEHRVSYDKRANHRQLVRDCFHLMTGREVIAATCRALRRRDAFSVGTDAALGSS